jgi:predicted nucleic acid-binding protein
LLILDTSVWIEHLRSNQKIDAGEYSAKNKSLDHGVGLIDAIILMHGIKSNSKIWTLDKKFLKIIPEELIYRE